MKNILVLCIFILTSVLAISQESYEALCEKGNEEIKNGNYAKALSFFDAAFKVGCENETERAWTSSIAAICAQKVPDLAKAIMYNNMAIESNTTDISVYEMQLEIAKQLNDNETIEKVLLLGREKLEGQYKRFTTKLLYFYYNNKMFDKAIPIAEEVLKYEPDPLKTLSIMGFSYLNNKKEAEAIETFNKVLALNKMEVDANNALGLLYYNQGSVMQDNAKEQYTSLKKPSMEDYAIYQKRYEKSIVILKKAIPYLENSYTAKPDDQIKRALFLLYTRLGQKEKAAKFKTN